MFAAGAAGCSRPRTAQAMGVDDATRRDERGEVGGDGAGPAPDVEEVEAGVQPG